MGFLPKTSVIDRVFKIKYLSDIGTAFIINESGSGYLISAKHLFVNDRVTTAHNSLVTIEILNSGAWIKYDVNVSFHENDYIDIAVMRIPEKMPTKKVENIRTTTAGLIYAQDVYILGYPLGIGVNDYDLNIGYPMPLVKKGIISTILTEKNATILLVDFMNNKGYSGGPVISTLNNEMNIVGVISQYIAPANEIYRRDENKREILTEYFMKENQGIGIAYGINHAHEIILSLNLNNKM